MRILFITSTRIGDAVLSSGALAYLVERHPQARFTVACGPAAAPLFEGVPRLERIIVMRKQKNGGHWLALWRATVLKPWYMVVDMRASAIAWALPALHRKVLSPFKSAEHRVTRFSKVMGTAHLLAPHIYTTPEAEARAATLLPRAGSALAIAPTANWIGKQWPIERFAAVARSLTANGGPFAQQPILVLGGPGERDAAMPLLEMLPADRTLALFGDVDLLTAYACLKRARLFVGNDSGLMHMASSTQIPTIGLFGPSRDEMYGPLGPRSRVVRGRTYEAIIADNFDYRANRNYMEAITVEMVLAAVREVLGLMETTAAQTL